MTEDRQKMLADYISHITSDAGAVNHYRDIGKKVYYISDFLNKAETVSKKGLKQYLITEVDSPVNVIKGKEHILDFLSFLGVGYKRKPRAVKSYEKIYVVSERNKELVGKFIETVSHERDLSVHTIRLLRDSMLQFFTYTNEFDNESCRRFVKTLEEAKRSPQTICSRIYAMRAFGNFVKKKVDINQPKIPRKLNTDNIPTEEEYTRLIEHLKTIKNKRFYFIVRVLASTGARYHEMCKVTWEDILNGEVMLSGKGNKYRRLYFTKSLQQEVREHLKEHHLSGIIATSKYGNILDDRSFNCVLKYIAKPCGISPKKLHAHAFRHFFAKMYLKKSKGDIAQLAEFLGHSGLNTTMIYLQKSHDEQKKEYNRSVAW